MYTAPAQIQQSSPDKTKKGMKYMNDYFWNLCNAFLLPINLVFYKNQSISH